MIVGKITSTLPAHEVFKLLKSTMISNVSDFEIQHTTTCEIFFTHGAVNMRRGQHPKRGKVLVQQNPDGSQIEYEIEGLRVDQILDLFHKPGVFLAHLPTHLRLPGSIYYPSSVDAEFDQGRH